MFLDLNYKENDHPQNYELSLFTRYLIAAVIAILSIALVFALIASDKAAPNVATLATEKLSLSGVENPVTAVLLNFRSYDTLLEVAVLLIVAVAVLPSVKTDRAPTQGAWIKTNTHTSPNPVLFGLLIWLVPLAILMGGYLLWTGAYLPGGAFQAGAVIAGAGVALSLAGQHTMFWESRGVRFVLSLGLIVFIAVAALSGLLTGTVLQYPLSHAAILILIIEIAATLSIVATLLLLFNRLQMMEVLTDERKTQ